MDVAHPRASCGGSSVVSLGGPLWATRFTADLLIRSPVLQGEPTTATFAPSSNRAPVSRRDPCGGGTSVGDRLAAPDRDDGRVVGAGEELGLRQPSGRDEA